MYIISVYNDFTGNYKLDHFILQAVFCVNVLCLKDLMFLCIRLSHSY